MGIIRRSLQISKTIRNVGRLKEIIAVFVRNGFDSLVLRTVVSKVPGVSLPEKTEGTIPIEESMSEVRSADFYKDLGQRLKSCFEELGPAFIKLGQLISSREDLFPSEFIEEMKTLRDKVKSIPFSEVRDSVEKSLGKNIQDVFQSVEESPIGTASVGVVYKGVLSSGEKVVLKVKRPGIEKDLVTDLGIISFLISQLERTSEDVKYLGISRVLKDFSITLQNELNFNVEVMNCNRFRENISKHDEAGIFYIPTMHTELCSKDLIVMELLEGFPFSNSAKVNENIEDIQSKILNGVEVLTKNFLEDGFFHADLHGGNFFYLENGKIGIIDYGLMGNLSKRSRISFVAILYALLSNDYENLVHEFLEVAEYETIPDVEALIRDVRDALSPFIGLTIQQTDFTLVLQTISGTLKSHQIFLPRDWYIVFRSLITLDGVGQSLNMDIDLFAIFNKDINGIVKNNFKKEELIEEGIWAARDLLSSSRVVPRHLKWFLKDFAKKGYAVEIVHKGHEKEVQSLSNSLIFLGNAFLTGIVFLSGVFLLRNIQIDSLSSIPTISWIFWGLSLAFLLNSLRIVKK